MGVESGGVEDVGASPRIGETERWDAALEHPGKTKTCDDGNEMKKKLIAGQKDSVHWCWCCQKQFAKWKRTKNMDTLLKPMKNHYLFIKTSLPPSSLVKR